MLGNPGLAGRQHAGRLLCVGARPHSQEHIRRADLELIVVNLMERIVVVLAGIGPATTGPTEDRALRRTLALMTCGRVPKNRASGRVTGRSAESSLRRTLPEVEKALETLEGSVV